MAVYTNPLDFPFAIKDLPGRPEPKNILMCSPDYFDVSEAINNFMTDGLGNLNCVDRTLAMEQWSMIRRSFDALGYPVHVLPGEKGLEDMVFSANQSFPFWNRKTSKPAVVMSIMRRDKRKGEVPHFKSWYERQGYEVYELVNCAFESNGDALWYPGKYLVISGFGSSDKHRTDKAALEQLSKIIDCPVAGIELLHPDFYHLNTTLSVIGPDLCIVYPPGVGERGMVLLHHLFKDVVEISKTETYAPYFACNAFSPDGETVLIQKTCEQTIRALEYRQKRVIGIDTSEFIKSGGSVFCMKIKVF